MRSKSKSLKIKMLRGIWRNLSRKRKRQITFLPILISLAAIFELFSVASIIPFLSLLSNPNKYNDFYLIKNIQNSLPIFDAIDPFIFVIFSFLFCITLSAILRLITISASNYFAAAIGSDFSSKAYRLSLNQPYQVHISRNSSEIISSIIQNTDRTVFIVFALLQFTASITLGLALIVGLLLINWVLSLIIAFIFSFLYLLLGYLLKKRIGRIDKKKARLTIMQTKALQEGLGSIRDIILDNSQKFYQNIFTDNDKPLRFINATSELINSSPKYIFELITIYIIVCICFFYNSQGESSNIIPLIGSILLCLQRLLPVFQNVYSCWVNISINTNSVLNLIKLLEQPEKKFFYNTKTFPLKNEIKLSNISFSYFKNTKKIIQDFNLTIKKGERIGIIGKSGSGKSTIADLIMGLLEPSKGVIEIDGLNLHKNKIYKKENWFSNIAHVPQEICFSDTNIAENIAFGIPKSKIDNKRLIKAIIASRLSDFINNVEEAYNIKVGERGVQLSGGQRQRVGIARAIYKGGKILIMDEATSALDTKTESEIMRTIDELSSDLTIIIITHRLSTLKSCERVIEIQKI